VLCIFGIAAAIPPNIAIAQTKLAGLGAQAQQTGACNPKSAVSAASVQVTAGGFQRKRWQPQGGVIQFTVNSFAPIPDKASFYVCFRWKTYQDTAEFFETRPDGLDRNSDGTTWTVKTTVPGPSLWRDPPLGAVTEHALPLVPLADVRIVAYNEDRTTAGYVATTIGITYPWAGIILAVATIVILLVGLTIVGNLRLEHEGIKKAVWFLRIISTPSGYASLSELQILLWTLVVAASAVYVMALSGDLIEITNGTLVLLGIAGAAALGAKTHSVSQESAADSAAAAARKEASQAEIEAAQKDVAASAAPGNVAARAEQVIAANVETGAKGIAATATARANAFMNPPENQIPRWSDLIVNEITKLDGTVRREIDITRFQMLLFTLITAAFVLLTVVTTYVIPEIPTGFVTLMGISNGVYLGGKVAQGS
jgi:hypothetical protein